MDYLRKKPLFGDNVSERFSWNSINHMVYTLQKFPFSMSFCYFPFLNIRCTDYTILTIYDGTEAFPAYGASEYLSHMSEDSWNPFGCFLGRLSEQNSPSNIFTRLTSLEPTWCDLIWLKTMILSTEFVCIISEFPAVNILTNFSFISLIPWIQFQQPKQHLRWSCWAISISKSGIGLDLPKQFTREYFQNICIDKHNWGGHIYNYSNNRLHLFLTT